MILFRKLKSSSCVQKFSFQFPFISWKWISYLGKWNVPVGHETGILMYNSAANKKVPLILKKKDIISWYMCGPTVYAESHIGHASCYVKFDIIRRILECVFNIDVNLCLGITDIDDKIIKKSNEEGVSAQLLAKKFEQEFFDDMKSMHVLPPTIVTRVSENIDLIISFCKRLIETEFAYVTKEGNVYFIVSKSATSDVSNKFPEKSLYEMIDSSKRNPRDFALWKIAKAKETSWDSPWGKGRPGWHIECSAMASKIFGHDLDLHSGGYDLLFPHHSNEKSQSEAFHGCSQWGNYWMHAGLLQVGNDIKMSKSLNNTISIKDFLKEHSVNDFRILCLQSLYRKNLFYNCKTLMGAKAIHKKFHNFINECELYLNGEIKGPIINEDELLLKLASAKEQVISFLSNDFNTSQVLLCLTNLIDEVFKSMSSTVDLNDISPDSISVIASIYFYILRVLKTMGISILSKKTLALDLVYAIDVAVEFRNKIRVFAMSFKDYGKNQNCACFIESSYKTFSIKNLPNLSKDYCKIIADIFDASNVLYEKAYSLAKKMDQENNLGLNHALKSKMMVPFFTACDEFRSTLLQKGIGIKDKGIQSVWIPLVEIEKYLKL